jgi:hypothetical protein
VKCVCVCVSVRVWVLVKKCRGPGWGERLELVGRHCAADAAGLEAGAGGCWGCWGCGWLPMLQGWRLVRGQGLLGLLMAANG